MNNKLKLAVSLCTFFCSPIASADCKLESEIPSSTPNSQFTAHADGTVTDNATNLIWAKCAVGLSGPDCSTGSATSTNWQGALQAAEASTLAGYSDWRLPNIKELRSIVEKRCFNPAINSAVFPNTPASHFWSASPNANYWDSALFVDFNNGESVSAYSSFGPIRSENKHVRLVRSA